VHINQVGCPLIIIIDQGVHVINDAIKFDKSFLIETCEKSTTYYYQGNEQVKFTNKVLRTLMTKLGSENRTNWDDHLPKVLFSYKIAYKIHGTHHIN
jgi:hypothetical protein